LGFTRRCRRTAGIYGELCKEHVPQATDAGVSRPAGTGFVEDAGGQRGGGACERTDARGLHAGDAEAGPAGAGGLRSAAQDASGGPGEAAVPSARIEVFEEARHALFVDDAERFDKTLDDFIAHLPDSGAKAPSGR